MVLWLVAVGRSLYNLCLTGTSCSTDGTKVNASVFHNASAVTKVGVQISAVRGSSDTTFLLGGQYSLDKDAFLKAKVAHTGEAVLGYTQVCWVIAYILHMVRVFLGIDSRAWTILSLYIHGNRRTSGRASRLRSASRSIPRTSRRTLTSWALLLPSTAKRCTMRWVKRMKRRGSAGACSVVLFCGLTTSRAEQQLIKQNSASLRTISI